MQELEDLQELKEELHKRLHFPEGSLEECEYEYERKRINDSYPDEGWRIPQGYIDSMKKIETNKWKSIKYKSKNNAYFGRLLQEKLPVLEEVLTRKKQELEPLVPPVHPNLQKRLYNLMTGRTNTFEKEVKDFNTRKKNLQDEISELESMKRKVEDLLPIYQE